VIVCARVRNAGNAHEVTLDTAGSRRTLDVPPKASGSGSAVNGGEFLVLALATCYCNDLYREALQRGVEVVRVEVTAEAEFGAPGAPASALAYRVTVHARAAESAIHALIVHTDRVAEVQNTLRRGLPVTLAAVTAIAVDAP
jgi:organic hydroperoxide reductase OsmC/OhrA